MIYFLFLILSTASFAKEKEEHPFIRLKGFSSPPVGLIGGLMKSANGKTIYIKGLCQKYPKECRFNPDSLKKQPKIKLTSSKKEQLEKVNHFFNKEIKPIEDIQNNQVSEFWDSPTNKKNQNLKGDCEEYALHKRQKLIEEGWPRSSLNLATVYDKTGAGHLVLIVRTLQGDYVLDNLTNEVLRWDKTGHFFISMSSRTQGIKKWFKVIHGDIPVVQKFGKKTSTQPEKSIQNQANFKKENSSS